MANYGLLIAKDKNISLYYISKKRIFINTLFLCLYSETIKNQLQKRVFG
jgi:hypothetical protein